MTMDLDEEMAMSHYRELSVWDPPSWDTKCAKCGSNCSNSHKLICLKHICFNCSKLWDSDFNNIRSKYNILLNNNNLQLAKDLFRNWIDGNGH